MAKRTDGRSRDRAASKAIDTMVSKLDPLLILGALSPGREKLAKGKGGKEVGFVVGTLTAQLGPKALEQLKKEDLVPVLVDAGDPDQVQKKVEQWNGRSWSVSATTLTVHVPRTRLADLARLAAVRYVEASHRLKPHCDFAHASTGLLLAGQRTVPQTGAGVIVGVIDSGIDSAHRAFWTGSQSRIIDYLDQESGKHHSQAEISAGAASASADEIGHGTHVAGIAAGNGGGSAGLKYAGVAPKADLAVVKTTFQTDQIVDGIRHIFELAAQRKQPCVVNLSLGGHFGGHDGSSIAERTIDQLSGPGRLVVVSAGNEGRDPIHAGASLPAGQPDPARWVANFALRPRDVGRPARRPSLPPGLAPPRGRDRGPAPRPQWRKLPAAAERSARVRPRRVPGPGQPRAGSLQRRSHHHLHHHRSSAGPVAERMEHHRGRGSVEGPIRSRRGNDPRLDCRPGDGWVHQWHDRFAPGGHAGHGLLGDHRRGPCDPQGVDLTGSELVQRHA